MRHTFGKTVVIGLGGSIMYPDTINFQFLKSFRNFILKRLDNNRFVIVAGGGRASRAYQEAAAKVTRVTDEDKDWLGIHATRSNAHLLRTIFRDVSDPVVLDKRWKVRHLRYPVTIASGWRPGWSTDYIAVQLACDFKISEVVIAGKPAHVYNKDFTKHSDAAPFYELTWRAYRKMVPVKWKPGAHAPVDPVAARLADKKGIEAIVVGGADLKNLSSLLTGHEFIGTVIR